MRVNRKRVLDAKEVSQLAIVITIVNDKIRDLAQFERAELMTPAETVGSIYGGCGNRFGWSHPQVCRRQ